MIFDVVTGHDAMETLSRVLGDDRVDGNGRDATRIAWLCGHDRLVLRVVAQRAAALESLSLSDLVEQLADERLKSERPVAAADDLVNVRPALSWAYRTLDEPLQRAFRRIGLHVGVDLGPGAAAALLGTSAAESADLMSGLASAHLLHATSKGRFQMPAKLASYARERSAAEDGPAERLESVRRGLGWYLRTADAGRSFALPNSYPLPATGPDAVDVPGFDDHREVMEWFHEERPNLLTMLSQASDLGINDIVWRLSVAIRGPLEVHSRWDDLEEVHRLGVAAARAVGDGRGEASNLLGLGDVHWRNDRYDAAGSCYRHVVRLGRDLADGGLEGYGMRGIGLVMMEASDIGAAVDHFLAAEETFTASGQRHGEAAVLLNLARCASITGDIDEAVSLCHEALLIFSEIDDLWSYAQGVLDLAWVAHDERRDAGVEAHLVEAADIFAYFGDQLGANRAMASLEDLRHRGRASRRTRTDEIDLTREFPLEGAGPVTVARAAHRSSGRDRRVTPSPSGTRRSTTI
ncbi:hypothetical protein [Thermomonospora umbrina]|uniref:Tetratricopeptide repeat protein n=1 Tax=Thermomonospora umbrina TaxID=111806 RepID=A0A3D9T171_9ACTN|nr:hypothetical protein [Thermomonospora umbrina]REF00561.1 hypothetical protein DFJ69_6111 [Thermomonospora umbrina]